jgi:ABC-type transport system involved in multi-copper enzyme maturation permease subunit
MLWYKAWRESRTRFGITALTLIGFCLFAVLFQSHNPANGSRVPLELRSGIYSEHIYDLIYNGTAKGVFATLIIFLGLGGLLREQRNRTAIFTLSLPVSRFRLIGTQLVVGMSEMAVLSLLPAFLIPSLSMFVHESYPLVEALHFSMLWLACGSLIFAAAFLMSVVLSGEYTAPVVCYVALMLQALIMATTALGRRHRLNLMWTMGDFGRMHWDSQHKFLISDPLPWTRLLFIMLIAVCMLALGARITNKQDF